MYARLLIASFLSGICILSSCKKKEEPKQIETTQPQKVVEEKKVETPKVEAKPVIQETPHYFLIAGCFEYLENANKLYSKLQKEGFPNAKVLTYYENLYLVSYEGYARKADALNALKAMKEKPDKKGTWLHHVK